MLNAATLDRIGARHPRKISRRGYPIISRSIDAGDVSRPLPTTQPGAVRRRRSERIVTEIVRHFRDWSGRRTAAPIRVALRECPCHSHADRSQFARDGRQVGPTETLQARVKGVVLRRRENRTGSSKERGKIAVEGACQGLLGTPKMVSAAKVDRERCLGCSR